MKIGYYCESPVDQAALAVFTEGILGLPRKRDPLLDRQGLGFIVQVGVTVSSLAPLSAIVPPTRPR